jgi:hypothetical protein
MQGLWFKIIGAVFTCIIYSYYYPGGDISNYLYHAKVINSSLSDSFGDWYHLMAGDSPSTYPSIYRYTSEMFWYNDSSTYLVSKIGALFGLLNKTSEVPISLMFAYVSYTGIWAMFETFDAIYPDLHKQLAIAFLFIPSVAVWGSPLLKDPICLWSMGWTVYTTFRLFQHRDFSFRNIALLLVSVVLLASIKIYILLALLPAISIWILLTYSKRLQSARLRWVLSLTFVGFAGGVFFFMVQRFAKELNEYSLDNIAKKAQTVQGWITYVSKNQEGSVYDLGRFDPTIQGMLSKFPQAVNVTLYRPYLWEARKPIVILSSLEATASAIFTLLALYKIGVFRFFRRIFTDPNLSFFFIFTIVFSFAVGISTGNFGSLSRYKIPCMPFFAAMLMIVYHSHKQQLLHEKLGKRARSVPAVA